MISTIVEAVYKDGVLQPAEPLSLDEHETVRLGILEGEGIETPRYAAAEGQARFTFNAPDYVLHREYLVKESPHAGIIVSKQHSLRETIRRLLDLLNRVTADEMQDQFWWI